MSQTKERIQDVIILLADIICFIAAYYLAGYVWLRVYNGFSSEDVSAQMDLNFMLILATVMLTSIFTGNTKNFTSRGMFAELSADIKKNVIFAGIIAVYELLRKDNVTFPRGVYVFTVVFSAILIFVVRCSIKMYLRYRNSRSNTLRVIMVTTLEKAEKAINDIQTMDDWLRRLDAVIILDHDMVGQEIGGVKIAANSDTMMKFIKNEVVDEVYLDIDYDRRESLKPMVMELEDMGIAVHIKLDMLETFQDFDASLGKLGNTPVVTFSHHFYDYRMLAVKRIMDIVGAFLGIIIMLVAMIFVVPAIKLESKGPVFFKQRRVGKNGRYFYIYKFRSMYIDAEERKKELLDQNEMSGFMFKMKDDPRITKVGRFIRQTSIDELPQFINVFLGDMSLVGTRPPTINEFKMYEGHHKRRLSMKPGITGMWQAYGRNSVVDFEDVVKMDLDYIDHWNLALDMKILAKTVVTVFTNRGK